MDALRLKSLLHGSAPVILRSANLFADVPARLTKEQVKPLADWPGARVERIVSTGQASPAGFWYDQDWAEGRGPCCRATMSSFRPMFVTASNGPIRTGRPSGSRFTVAVESRVKWTPSVEPRAAEFKVQPRVPLSFKNQDASVRPNLRIA